MARINLKDKKAGRTSLLVVFEQYKQRVRIPTGLSVPPKYWNANSQQVRENKEFTEWEAINKKLKDIKRTAAETEDYFKDMGVTPSMQDLKSKYYELTIQPQRGNNTAHFWHYYNEFIEAQRSKMTPRSLLDYDKALRKHLANFESAAKISLSLNSFREREGVVRKFEKYLFTEAKNALGEKGMLPNTVGKQMKNLKVFLKWCFKNEYCETFDISHIVKHEEESDHIYLTDQELEKIFTLQLEDDEQAKVRDLFIFGCETGLRFSDLRRTLPKHILNGNIEIFQQKVNSKVSIPLSSRARAIVNKYDMQLPNYKETDLTNFNSLLRGICDKAEINSHVCIREWKKKSYQEVFYPKSELVSSHTCRRSFCTNRFKAGIPPRVIMAISGHKTEKSFLKYLKLSDSEILEIYRDKLTA